MRRIKCLVLDVDGVLTDGRIYVHDNGCGMRAFHVQDGLAIRWFQELGGTVILLSGKDSPAVAARAAELGIRHVLQGSRDKVADLAPLLAELGLDLSEVAMIGDDLPDIGVMRRCGVAIAPANARPEVLRVAHHVTARGGGEGAVREAIERLLRDDGRWAEIATRYEAADALLDNGPRIRGPM